MAWLWYFIDLHRVRYSHAGHVCFGDYLQVSGDPGSPYLLNEGSFLKYMIISQWLFIGLILYGLMSNLIVIIMRKVEERQKADSRRTGSDPTTVDSDQLSN